MMFRIILSVSKLLSAGLSDHCLEKENSVNFGIKTLILGEDLFRLRSIGIVLLVIKYD